MITLTREGGSPAIMTPSAARKLMDSEANDIAFVFAMLGVGNTMCVKLTTGETATLRDTEDPPDQTALELEPILENVDQAPTNWPLAATKAENLRPHLAHAKAYVELDVDVALLAIDEEDADRMIREVFRGERISPPGFHLIWDRGTTSQFVTNLRDVLQGTREIASLGVVEGSVTGFSNPSSYQIAYDPGKEP